MNEVKKNILIISGGTVNESWLREWTKENEIYYCIAADKGLEAAYRTGLKVNHILGDFDSVDKDILAGYKDAAEVEEFSPEKDYTDTHLAVIRAVEFAEKYNMIDDICLYVAGATGTRIDHTLTNIYVLLEALKAGIEAYIIDERNKVYIKDRDFSIEKECQYGRYVSFIPVTKHVRLSLDGMKYNLDNYVLKQGKSICQSNEIAADKAVVTIAKGKLIVVESRD